MVHEISQYLAELPTIEDFLAGDDRTLAFQVVDGDGVAVDISNATVEWQLFERPYETETSEEVLSGSDSDVEIVTDSRVDTTNGEFEIRLDGSATAGLWGRYYQRPVVTQPDGTRASWRGEIVITA